MRKSYEAQDESLPVRNIVLWDSGKFGKSNIQGQISVEWRKSEQMRTDKREQQPLKTRIGKYMKEGRSYEYSEYCIYV